MNLPTKHGFNHHSAYTGIVVSHQSLLKVLYNVEYIYYQLVAAVFYLVYRIYQPYLKYITRHAID